MQLRTATRKKAKIRLGLTSVSGGGKTLSALLIAKGLCGDWTKVAIIDTENGSADLYSHLGPYNVLQLAPPFEPEKYIKAIRACESAGMEVIIVDSISHEWDGKGGILEMADNLGGQYQSAWKVLTPRHEAFKQSIIQSACHVITTVRRKQDYILQEKTNKQGKVVQSPVKAGFKEITREGWEYELTINLELELNHYATAAKDRTGLFMDKPQFIPSEATGELIKEWCDQGVDEITEKIDWPSLIVSCQTKADIVNLYNNHKDEIDQDKSLQHMIAKRRDEVLSKENPSQDPSQASSYNHKPIGDGKASISNLGFKNLVGQIDREEDKEKVARLVQEAIDTYSLDTAQQAILKNRLEYIKQ